MFDTVSILMSIYITNLIFQIAAGTTNTVDRWALSVLMGRVERFRALPRWWKGIRLAILVNVVGLPAVVGVAIALDAPLPLWWQWWALSFCLTAGLWGLWKVIQWDERSLAQACVIQMNLNLPKYSCVLFRVSGQSRVSDERDDELRKLMSATHAHTDADGLPRVALFGSKYTTGGVVSRAEGALYRRRQGDEVLCSIEVSYEQPYSDLSRPPRDYKPMSLLIGQSVGCLGVLGLECLAVFEYPKSGTHRSKGTVACTVGFPRFRWWSDAH